MHVDVNVNRSTPGMYIAVFTGPIPPPSAKDPLYPHPASRVRKSPSTIPLSFFLARKKDSPQTPGPDAIGAHPILHQPASPQATQAQGRRRAGSERGPRCARPAP